jgi:phospho-N-acetylmuramoyl-pentapeptide-transferase
MFFYFQEELRALFGPLNVLRYTSFRVIAAFITALLICLFLYPWFIKILQRYKIGQTIRDDGPQSHKPKEGTPTMGGTLILLSILLSTVLWADITNIFIIMSLSLMLLFGFVGFYDDLMKLKYHNPKGLSGKFRLIIEFSVTAAVIAMFFTWFAQDTAYSFRLYVPFVSIDKFYILLPPVIYLIFAAVVVVGTANSSNLTDGLDGLAIGPIIIGSGTFLVFSYITGAKLGGFDISKYLLLPKVVGVQELSVLCSSIMGAGIAFLYYNTYPAEIFMGDTGSLSLGAGLGSVAVFTKNEILSALILGILVFEASSVILQTTYYKFTKKRLFRMAPVHHSFELIGWAEPKIVVRFWIISIILSLIALASIKIR